MSMGKHQDRASQQLQLFGCELPSEVVATRSAFVDPQPVTRSGLRLVSNTVAAQQSRACLPADDMTAIEARLIGKTKFF